MLTTCALSNAQFIDRYILSPAGGFFEKSTIQMTWVIGDIVAGDLAYSVIIDPYVNLIDIETVSSNITVFPNPTTDRVYLKLDMEDIENCTYYLYDLQGREIQNRDITAKMTELSFTPYESGVYLLRIIKEKTLVQEFKIIKR